MTMKRDLVKENKMRKSICYLLLITQIENLSKMKQWTLSDYIKIYTSF